MVSENEIALYKRLIPDCKIIFDVGCKGDNIFYEINPSADIHLFDPTENDALINSISGIQNVKYNNYALGNFKGKTQFHFHYGSILLRDDVEKYKDSHQEKTINVDTLFNYCKESNITQIDFLKIDTEGYDFEVIKGAKELIHNVKYIQVEEWDDQKLMKDIFDFFEGYNKCLIKGKPNNYLITKEKI